MSKDSIAVSSLSCLPVDTRKPDQIVIPGRHTDETLRGVISAVANLQKIFGQVTVSIHPTRFLQLEKMIEELMKRNIDISSIDAPDHETLFGLVRKQVKDGDLINDIGWWVANRGNTATTAREISQVFQEQLAGKVLRVNASYWLDSNYGEALTRKFRRAQRKLRPTLAIEIAYGQSVEDYLEFVKRMQRDLLGILAVKFDFDIGHVHQSLDKNKSSENPTDILEKIVADPYLEKMLAIVSLSPNVDHHENFWSALEVYRKAVSLLSTFEVEPEVLLEPSPKESREVFANNENLSQLKRTFN